MIEKPKRARRCQPMPSLDGLRVEVRLVPKPAAAFWDDIEHLRRMGREVMQAEAREAGRRAANPELELACPT